MIIIFAIFLTTVCAYSHEKYINLLPDEGKDDLLDNVARKIMESVVSNDTNTERIEPTNAQLTKHNSYGQSVMEQETAAFEARRNKREDKSSEEDNNLKKNHDSEEDLGVKPIQILNGVDNLHDVENKKSATSDVNGKDTSEVSNITDSYKEKIKMFYPEVSTLNLDTQIQKLEPVSSTTLTKDLKIDTTNTPLSALVNNLQYETSSETSVPLSVTVTGDIQQVNNVSTETTTGSKIQILQHDYATNSNTVDLITEGNDYLVNDIVTSLNATESFTQYGSDSSLTSSSANENIIDLILDMTTNESTIRMIQGPEFTSEVYTVPENYSTVNCTESSLIGTKSYKHDSSDSALTDESTTYSVIDTTTNKSRVVVVNSQVFTTTTQTTAKIDTNTTKKYSEVTKKELLETIIEITTIIPILTTFNMEEKQTTKAPKKIKLNNIIKQPKNDTLVSYIVNRALKKIKHALELKKQGTPVDNDVKTTYKGDTHVNHYRVYEIAWPTKSSNQPFIRRQEPIKDQPYFFPVFKYSPNFAYYNPKNRLSTNEVEENLIESKTHQFSEGNKYIHDEERSELILQLNNGLRKFVHLRKGRTTTAPYWEQRDSDKSENSENSNNSENSENSDNSENSESYDEGVNKIIKRNRDNKTKKKKSKTEAESLSRVNNYHSISLNKKTKPLDNPTKRSNAESKLSIYMNVLKDLILDDSNVLKQYDWLTTALQIQTALSKILKLIKHIKQSAPIHPYDLQILKYVAFLYNLSLEIKEDNKVHNKFRNFLRNKKKRKNKLLKVKGLNNRVKQYLRRLLPDLVEDDGLSHLYEFLVDVQDRLFDLHEAIRHIADLTKFDRKNWYGNLKQLYLSTDEKHLRDLLLHISMFRLVDLLEHSCKHSLDPDFIQFVKTNKKDAKNIVEEMIFINDILYIR